MGALLAFTRSLAAVLLLVVAPTLAFAQVAPGLPAPLATRLMSELVGLLVVATVMESALSTLFNWRLYREFFNGRSVKTMVMIGFGYAVVETFDYDIFQRIVTFAGGRGETGFWSNILSALVLAGGSAAVFELLKALGLRAPIDPAAERPLPPQDKAWFSVRVVPKRVIGPVRIHVEKVAEPTKAEQDAPAIAGVLARRTFSERFKGVFLADPMRFPSYGGRTVEADQVKRILATGQRRQEGNDGVEDFSEEIFVGRFAGRAIVDFVCEI